MRKIIARRSLLEFPPGDICNLGFGISQLIGRVAWEEGITDQLVLTVEQGIFGGVPVAGNEGGAGFNYQAMIDQPTCSASTTAAGSTSPASRSPRSTPRATSTSTPSRAGFAGPGGFPNISAKTGKINFVGTLTAQGLELDIDDGVRVVSEGSLAKFVPEVRQISFNGTLARERGQQVRYITDRAVFELADDGLVLIEVAPGIDLERDVLAQMGFRPRVADDLRTIDAASTRRADGPRRRLRGADGEHERLIELELGTRGPPRRSTTRRSTSSRRAARRSSTRRSRRWRPRPGRRRAVVVTGRRAGVLGRIGRQGVRVAARRRRPGAARARGSHVQAPRRAADADDRGDRGQRARRRPRAGARLRPPRRLRAREARPARGAAGRDARRGRHPAAAARRRCGRAKELTLTGRIIDAARGASGSGSSAASCRRARPSRGRDEIAAEIAQRGPLAVREAKRLIDAAVETDIDAGLAAEIDASDRVFDSEDMLEGARAFFDKRPPGLPGPMRSRPDEEACHD